MKLFSLLFIALACAPLLHAQQPGASNAASSPVPTGPLIQWRAPEMSRWVITYNPRKADRTGEGAASSGERVGMVKTGKILLRQCLDANGRRVDRWCVGNLQFSLLPGSKQYVPYDKGSFLSGVVDENLYTDYSKTDFPGFEWVSAANYAEVKKVMDRDCLVFRENGEDGKTPMTACVDLKSRLPVVLQKGGETRVYEFQPAPQAMLTLPPDIQKSLEMRAKLKR